ncbi:LysE family translocator [Acetobacter oeni]|uniref:Amino acid transporter n=1 Tax=Acetobacter oeni TaxID=304077 RepID=A0A511XMS4_9PROT|nr:LysE family translocator [Acetobacter oeni]MBB3882861.1 threonine/homoserine/homoserine lactone efflux protein [Acetobacter oeni]NHO18947.1 LysE family translocator [Acetobacter oeni]GBR01789.1 putative threonine efflux protein [Acetobacter oeni LMG 21952]GEN64240.1 amino acid transporter [Acetobacter oeni]
MTAAHYLAFLMVAAAQVATPGPSTVFLVNNAVSLGFRRAIFALSGDLCAILLLATLSAAGVGALITASPMLFIGLRLFGAAYLIWLGIRYLRPAPPLPFRNSNAPNPNATTKQKGGRASWIHSFSVGISNPKAILFFSALFPQFISDAPGHRRYLILAVLVISFAIVKFLVLGIYAILARRIRSSLSRPGVATRGRLTTGAFFLLFGTGLIISIFVG